MKEFEFLHASRQKGRVMASLSFLLGILKHPRACKLPRMSKRHSELTDKTVLLLTYKQTSQNERQ